MDQHKIDVYPEPREETPRFINEPWLIDKYLYDYGPRNREPDHQEDNIRIYVPLDLNRDAILKRLQSIISRYKESNEENEADFRTDVDMLIEQIAIYDRIWYIRTMAESDKQSTKQHSIKGRELASAFIEMLGNIPDGCAECFPDETIDELKREYEC